jgi:hypothetical protein
MKLKSMAGILKKEFSEIITSPQGREALGWLMNHPTFDAATLPAFQFMTERESEGMPAHEQNEHMYRNTEVLDRWLGKNKSENDLYVALLNLYLIEEWGRQFQLIKSKNKKTMLAVEEAEITEKGINSSRKNLKELLARPQTDLHMATSDFRFTF